MARKSSKTAHVMNLLAGEESESSKSEAAKENLAASLNTDSSETIKELTVLAHKASIQTQEGPLSPSPISIIDMSSSAPDPVSELIRQQLEEEEGIAPEDDTESVPLEITSIENSVPEADRSVSEESSSTMDPVPKEDVATQRPPIPTYQYVNVMEYIVKSLVDTYVSKFDTCSCGRCVADITALTLTKLAPKYIVVESNSASPLLNFYTNRYSQQVIVEITKSCFVVKQNPHH
ncbi:late competence development ComFB family protein [Lacrimispora sp. JR3]|uniref:late competence development ComFB family protein n=1 Tax=Lacrimispora sinapis TaxID=3111456 RepID=UPI0037481B63